jgi:YHS domain-containing protein/thioredoxin-related protein
MRHRFLAQSFCALASTILALSLPELNLARASDGEPGQISWRSDYAQALNEARTKNRLLWIQFTGPWCPSCRRMEEESFPHPTIRSHARNSFVPVKLRSDVNQDLALSFDLTGLPATVIVAPTRQVLAVRQGYLDPRKLGEVLEATLARHERALRDPRDAVASSAQPRAQASHPSPPSTGKTETELALSGYCPVSLVSDKRLVQGQAEYTVTHGGRLYRFANMLTFNLFRGDPERFVPANGGNCPVAQIERDERQRGQPHFGALYQGRLYLCASDADRERFLREPARYAVVDVAEQGNCPHCLAESGALVHGDPRFDLNLKGRRYWFPDASHRAAFLASAPASAARR